MTVAVTAQKTPRPLPKSTDNIGIATSYTSQEWQRELVNKVTAFVQSNISFIGVDFLDPSSTFEKPSPSSSSSPSTTQPRSVRVLDYACGPGTMTAILAGRASEFVGVDLSENMVQAYNSRFADTTDPESDAPTTTTSQEDERINAHAVVGNLLTTTTTTTTTGGEDSAAALAGPQFYDFDLAVVGLGFHHFADIRLATRRLVERLKPGGVFMIVDFVTHAMEAEESPELKESVNTISHHGFSEGELRAVFAEAGLDEFALVRMGDHVTVRGSSKREPFMARGRKV
ncbi:hypothetical protein PV08_04415 [Exophiala spinifera]|uniref:Methyltransferase type 11 domain-containing protein n=1 Tax=Exophiala spinifera TaxID=91928 RepID=A0A0D2C0M9_9EURO|nr:uncharacterized protein PV08_04415 [Exophiala spinifera]KIW17224.1 hypothetical protein PV08_04415 [Exophiala spinifera]